MKCNNLQKSMNILVPSNEAYLPPLSVMLYSLAYHNAVDFDVYILHFEIPEKVQQEFCRRMAYYVKQKMQIHFVKADRETFDGIAENKRYKRETTLRLLMLKHLPYGMERILWLDVDIIVKGDIQKFYQYPNKGQYAFVCDDMFPSNEKSEVLRRNGMRHKDRYFNAGVILFYLNNMRNDFAEDDFVDWMRENPDKIQYQDQSVLNYCFAHRLSWADPCRYNLQTLRLKDTSEGEKLLKNAKIVHYNTKKKPWQDNYDGAGEVLYWRYALRVLGIKAGIFHYVNKFHS